MENKKCEYSPVYFDTTRKEWFKGYYLGFPDSYHVALTKYYGCGNDIWGEGNDERFCIFHSQREDKARFTEEFRKYLKENDHNFSFIGFVLPGKFSLGSFFTTLKDANFYDAVFYCTDLAWLTFGGDNGTNFMNMRFMNGANFTGTLFEGKGQVGFNYARFIGDGDVKFYLTRFFNQGTVNFSRAIFAGGGQSNFSESIFSGNTIRFENTYFSLLGGLGFNNTSFLNDARVFFKGTVFDHGTIVDFRDVDLDEAKKISFDKADLSCCNFLGTNLRKIEFKESYFNRYFRKYLINALSIKSIQIERDKVLDEIIQNNDEYAVADSIVSIIDITNYGNKVRLVNDLYKKDNDWEYKAFLEIVRHEKIKGRKQKELEAELTENYNSINALSNEAKENIENLQAMELYKRRKQLHRIIINLIEKSSTREIYWRLLEKIVCRYGDPVYEAILKNIVQLEAKNETSTSLVRNIRRDQYKEYYKIKQLYSQLRLNYEESGRYHEAGEFFIGEMEMRRKLEKNKKSILFLYKLFSLFGERPSFATFWILASWFLFSLSHICFGMGLNTQILGNDQTFHELINWDVELPSLSILSLSWIREWACSLWQGFLVVLSNLTLGRFVAPYMLDPESVWSPLFRGFEFLFGAITIPLFVLAMNRKFRRTKD